MQRAAKGLVLAMVVMAWVDNRADAATIGFDPSAATIATPGSLALNLKATGLGGTPSSVIGGFDLFVSWDPTVLQFNEATLGSALGAIPAEAITTITPGPSSVELFETSLLSATALAALQNGAVVLSNLSWTVLSAQSSHVDVSGVVSDALGNSLSVQFGSAQLNAVPEPSTGLLSTLSLLMLGVIAIVRRQSV